MVTILPGGSTSRIQPMDVGVNKPFMDHLSKFSVNHMLSNDLKEISRQKISHKKVLNKFQKINPKDFPQVRLLLSKLYN